MRLDIPQDVPRRREIGLDNNSSPDNRKTPPASPETPVQQRLDSLRERADNRQPYHPRPRMERGAASRAVPREPRTRTVDPEDTRRAHRLPHEVIGLELRAEEKKLLTEVGRFRVFRIEDLNRTIYDGKSRKLENDLNYLRYKGLVESRRVNLRHDGKRRTVERVEVPTLTKAGRSFLIKQGDLPKDQRVYAGLVKPREVEHDSQIYRAYRKEVERIEKTGGSNLRMRLDYEIKSQVQKAIYAERKADPKRDMAEIKQQVAERFELPFVDGTIQIPDVRIDYDLPRKVNQDVDQGSRTGHEDIEVLTAAYHAGHLRSKAQAGFRNYASTSDRATLTAKIEDDSRLMENILGPVMAGYDPIPMLENAGYTEQEASFLYLVAVHPGYFLRRQFSRFVRRDRGGLADKFIQKALRLDHLQVIECGQTRHVYHLTSRPMYQTILRADSQHRRFKGFNYTQSRRLILDFVLDIGRGNARTVKSV